MALPGSGHAGWNLPARPPAPRCRPGQPWLFAAGDRGKVGEPGPYRRPHRDRRTAGLTLAATGAEAAAVTALTGALMLACPQGHKRVSPTRARRWRRCSAGLIVGQRAGQAAAGVPFGYLARLQRAFAAGPPA